MNMFKKGRKAKAQDDAPVALTLSESSTMGKAHRALTRKKKKTEVDETPTFDLSTALPDTNDFRTSLLMPNLSARFSMLREQDDPHTLIGKASDDSVLFPKRASRLNLFNNYHLLNDIAEVESIHSAFRPPFADERSGSMSDGYASDDGASMINRARPADGNNLFGGRQKMYKIPTSSAKTLPSEGGMTRGKHVYENDVALSSFQQLRLREKEQREAVENADRSSFPNADPEEQDSTRSPLTAFSQNRGTQSSTNSGPSNRRTSTAATSVVSDSPLPQRSSNSAINKLKEQDANSSAESIGLASSPGLQKIQEDTGHPAHHAGQPRGVTNLKDNHTRQLPATVTQSFHALSPPPSATTQPLDFGLRDLSRPLPSPSRFRAASPTAAFDFGQDETPLSSNVRPNDRGKATAMGLFNKPSHHYDDVQFQQRQVEMYEGRISPSSRSSPEPVMPAQPNFVVAESPTSQEDSSMPQVPTVPDPSPPALSLHRFSATSAGRRSSSRPRTKSSASSKEATVQARVQSLIRKQNAELVAMEESHLRLPRSRDDGEELIVPPCLEMKHEPQIATDEIEHRHSGPSSRRPSTKSVASLASLGPPPPPLPPTEIHPAFRDGIQDFDFGTTESRKVSYPRYSNHSTTSKAHLSVDRSGLSQRGSMLSTDDGESANGPSTTGLGLSGLIRTHLRHDSDRSSMLHPPSPILPSDGFRASTSSIARTVTESVKSDPFEFDNETNDAPPPPSEEPPPPPTPTFIMSQRAQQMLANAAAIRDAQANGHHLYPTESVEDASESQNDDRASMDNSNHSRNESTETQREQQRFDEELAERRRRVQEGLKSVQERSRSRSPETDRTKGNQGHGFTLPRFPGRSNTGDKLEPQPQNMAMKMLGISSTGREQSSPRIPVEPQHPEGEAPRNPPSRQGHRPTMPQAHEYSNGRHTPNAGRPSGARYGQDRSGPPRSTTPTSRPNMRSRSHSSAAERSASRNQHIPESDQARMPGAFPASPFLYESPQNEYGPPSASPSGGRTYERSGSGAAGNYQDRQAYFNSKSLAAPGMTGEFTPRPSPRPSPNPSESIFAAQMNAPMSPSSVAVGSPRLVNGRTTPTSTGRTTPSRDRKRSVTKQMISEPTFVSSTSTVPLVYLPRDGGPPVEPLAAPPLPTMNPRRRGNTGGEPQYTGQYSMRPLGSPLPVVPASPVIPDFQPTSPELPAQAPPPLRARNKLRKSSSEGGSIAARARHQVFLNEMAIEKERSPNVVVFPNKSATSLHTSPHEGGMF